MDVPPNSKDKIMALCYYAHCRDVTATLQLADLTELVDRHPNLDVPDGQLLSDMKPHAFIKVTNRGKTRTTLPAGEGVAEVFPSLRTWKPDEECPRSSVTFKIDIASNVEAAFADGGPPTCAGIMLGQVD
ncbi:MAG: hypothetical protein SGPRY_007821 [Prymnesium sp.]